MPEKYNPIVRTFNLFRSEVARSTIVPRGLIHPFTSLEILLPVKERRAVWKQLQRKLPHLPELELPKGLALAYTLGVIAFVINLALALQRWVLLLFGVTLGRVVYLASRPQAVRFPMGIKTVGELVLYAISFPEHKESGYRWTKNEIGMKVRFLLAEALNQPLDKIRPESTLSELGAD